jgi:hypothetical protein
MVIIETYEWGTFQASTFEKVKEEIVEKLASEHKTIVRIYSIENEKGLLDKSITQIEDEIEDEIQGWLTVAKIESEGLRRAQQESMEG